jgi:hypothetical protein
MGVMYMMSNEDIKCNNRELEEFSHEHYTYINQFFGDETVRKIITKIFPNKNYIMAIEKANEDFEHVNDEEEPSMHHFLYKKNGKEKEKICSGINGYQNMDINKNDTLCQSYSLLTYLNKDIDPDQKERQMDMITMYRDIIDNEKFKTEINDLMFPGNNKRWKISGTEPPKYINPNREEILAKIKEVLDKWESYGYYYFIGNGKCPKGPSRELRNLGDTITTMTTSSPSIIQTRRLRTRTTSPTIQSIQPTKRTRTIMGGKKIKKKSIKKKSIKKHNKL